MSPWLSDLFLSSQSDERLVSLARAGHDRAFVAIVERYRRQLHAHARRIDSHGRAEDIVQQAFLSAFAALRAGVKVQHLRGWLYQIVRNSAMRASTQRPNDAELDASVCAGDVLEDTVEQREFALAALSEVARLPDRQRDALVETAINGRSRAEVAASMGVSEGAVRQLVHRARATLRTAVTAITPFSFADWLVTTRSIPSPDRAAEIALGASAASAGGLAAKIGAVVATGVIAPSVISSEPHSRPSQRLAITRTARVGLGASSTPAGAHVLLAGTSRASGDGSFQSSGFAVFRRAARQGVGRGGPLSASDGNGRRPPTSGAGSYGGPGASSSRDSGRGSGWQRSGGPDGTSGGGPSRGDGSGSAGSTRSGGGGSSESDGSSSHGEGSTQPGGSGSGGGGSATTGGIARAAASDGNSGIDGGTAQSGPRSPLNSGGGSGSGAGSGSNGGGSGSSGGGPGSSGGGPGSSGGGPGSSGGGPGSSGGGSGSNGGSSGAGGGS